MLSMPKPLSYYIFSPRLGSEGWNRRLWWTTQHKEAIPRYLSESEAAKRYSFLIE